METRDDGAYVFRGVIGHSKPAVGAANTEENPTSHSNLTGILLLGVKGWFCDALRILLLSPAVFALRSAFLKLFPYKNQYKNPKARVIHQDLSGLLIYA